MLTNAANCQFKVFIKNKKIIKNYILSLTKFSCQKQSKTKSQQELSI